ncbi:PTS system mannose/fructose/N-acetylgalactosamine-transporter subunit IIB [Brenneria goodwinii]|nr:PTS sugar transporter subunit IIB [Brenneria goodwinii]
MIGLTLIKATALPKVAQGLTLNASGCTIIAFVAQKQFLNQFVITRRKNMGVVLARIDQRLIHGIVVTQWAGFTKAKRLMVVDDEISHDETQKEVMRMSKPVGTNMSIIDTATAITNFNNGKYDDHNVLLIVNSPETLLRLVNGGVKIPKVNIGIIFDGEDKTTLKKMVSVNKKETDDLKELSSKGIPVTFHFVPNDVEEPLETYIK